MAGPFGAAEANGEHLIPADKRLSEEWIRALFERGVKEVYSGEQLGLIGMPCGGIGAGQLYLAGDGTLGSWQIFNRTNSQWVEGTGSSYGHPQFDSPIKQGFEIRALDSSGTPHARVLNREGFPEVTFKGEYPIGTVTYKDDAFPLHVEMEAFSPFIPCDAFDSSLPATLFHVKARNTSSKTIEVSVRGWLESAVCGSQRENPFGLRTTTFYDHRDHTMFVHGATTHSAEDSPNPSTLFVDFEGEGYGDWTASGEAFGTGPVAGTLPNQMEVSGYIGERLANGFVGGDQAVGTLTSPEFTVERHFINILIGGGPHKPGNPEGETTVNLVVDGETVRTLVGDSSEKLFWKSWDVKDLIGKKARIAARDTHRGHWGHIQLDQIVFADNPAEGLVEAHDYGTMALSCHDAVEQPSGQIPEQLQGMEVLESGMNTFPTAKRGCGILETKRVTLKSGEEHTFAFALAWHFPNHPKGHYYHAFFANAKQVVQYLIEHHDRLTKDTRLWRDTYYDSTLPYWLLDRLHAPVSYLATGTAEWWGNGRFWAYEGVHCCEGTCTHVWNYAHGHARLFPEIGRNIRERQDFAPRTEGGGFHPDTGLVGFRSNDAYAADGQCGTILKAYREHLMSSDDNFLRRNWPAIKKALQYSIEQDANADGLIENSQHNTYDINYVGANTFVGALYLAALRAGEEMAKEMGDTDFAQLCRKIFDSGSALSVERLWDGEYFIQDVDVDKHPKHQYGKGCLSDHMFGQGWAHQVKLGYLYPEDKVKSALQSVWKYNWAPDIAPYNEQHKPGRWFISPGMAGLFTCTWPKGEYLPQGTLYKNEVWTGIEYQVAGHMVWEGMLEEGLTICKAVHDRYQPEQLNPYNEVECGDHYSRAMASWGVYLALCGFDYHGPRGHLGFSPRMTPDNLKMAFTTAEGWATFEQEREKHTQKNAISQHWGDLQLSTLSLDLPEGAEMRSAKVKLNSKRVNASTSIQEDSLTFAFEERILLAAGDRLEVSIRLA